jgi:hypothetical protein
MNKSLKSNNFYLLTISFMLKLVLFFCISGLILDVVIIINDLMGNTEITNQLTVVFRKISN